MAATVPGCYWDVHPPPPAEPNPTPHPEIRAIESLFTTPQRTHDSIDHTLTLSAADAKLVAETMHSPLIE